MNDAELRAAIRILEYRAQVTRKGVVLSKALAEAILAELRTLEADRKAAA